MISVIVPTYNAEKTLGACLSSLQESTFKDFELIVVDDGSRDGTADIANRFPCRLVQTEKNEGPSHGRNTGVLHAQHEIFVFIDSDVLIKKDTLSRIHKFFLSHPEASAIMGMLDTACPHQGFFSQYKNLYMNYIFSKIQSPVTFLYGAIHAVRKKDFLPYDESLSFGEDTDLGQRLSNAGKTIFLDKEIQVTHLKSHNLTSLIRNDFRIPFYWAHLFFRHFDPSGVWKKKRFAHARGTQLASLFVSSSIALMLLLSGVMPPALIPAMGLLLALFCILNAGFFRFLFHRRGLGFALRGSFLTLLDQVVMTFGIATGTIHHFRKLRKKSGSRNRAGILKRLNYWSESQRVDGGLKNRLVVSIKDAIYFPVHYLCVFKPIRKFFFHFFGTLGCYNPKNRAITSRKHRFIYFYIPKVASTSLKRILSKNLLGLDTGKRVHCVYFEEVIDVKGGEYEDFFKFAFVRNPWDRIVSCYADKILHEDVTNNKYKNGVFRRYERKFGNTFHMGMSFESFVKVIHGIPDHEADRHFQSQHNFISDKNGRILVDFVGRFENLAEDYAHIARKCGLADFVLPHENRSKRANDYRSLYTPETRRLIEERYQRDIELFDYRF